ncbi:MAG TPA: hypothetical protein VK797_22770 [Tepidisphaeraceae bacterium]|nr:hypothetical protein [Tepidisphaeraceae bacterium]
MAKKRCQKCRRYLFLSSFSKNARSKDGRQAKCKKCVSAYMKARTIAKGDELRKRSREHYRRHRKERLAAVRRYRLENPEKVAAQQRARYLRYRERYLAESAEYRSRPEVKSRIKKRAHRYYRQHRDELIEYQKQYRETARGKRVFAAAHAREKQHHAGKIAARYHVANALRDGRLQKPERCQRCGKRRRLTAHHHKGYARKHRLDVRWLCNGCHKIEDGPVRRIPRKEK